MAQAGGANGQAFLLEALMRRQALAPCGFQFPDSHGPIDGGMHWDHDLQVTLEAGGWHTVTLPLTGTRHFVEEFLSTFGGAED